MDEQPHPDRVRLLPWSVPAPLVDAALIALSAGAVVIRATRSSEVNAAIEVLALLAAAAVIIGRRWYPTVALVVALTATTVALVASDSPSIIMPATLVALYHLATLRPWRVAVAAGATSVVVFATVVITLLEQGRIEGGALAAVAWPAFAAAIGAAVRASRESLAGAEERARRAEATQELEARRRVSEERLRIARDVHDLVGHHLAVVNVQAGVASHVLRTNPDAAEDALATIRTSASTGVDELGHLLGVLRDPGEIDGPTDPTPGLDAVDDLISSFAASGLTVEHTTSGSPRPLRAATGVAAYRVIQEALTNAHKHGDGAVDLSQRFDDTSLEIVATNRDGAKQPTEQGRRRASYGLAGMRERVEAAGGTLIIDDDGGRFTVRATLPTEGAS